MSYGVVGAASNTGSSSISIFPGMPSGAFPSASPLSRSLASRDETDRSALAQRIVSYLQTSPTNAELRQSLEVLDKLGPLPPRSELVVARAASAAGLPARAVAGYGRIAAGAPLSPVRQIAHTGH